MGIFPDFTDRVIQIEIAFVTSAKGLDAATTFFAISTDPNVEEGLPFTRFFIDVLGLPLGLLITSIFAVLAIVIAAELGAALCSWAKSTVGVEDEYDHPCIARHGTYALTSFLFLLAAVWNFSLIIG